MLMIQAIPLQCLSFSIGSSDTCKKNYPISKITILESSRDEVITIFPFDIIQI